MDNNTFQLIENSESIRNHFLNKRNFQNRGNHETISNVCKNIVFVYKTHFVR